MSNSEVTFDIQPTTGMKHDTPTAILMGFSAPSAPDGRLWCQWTRYGTSKYQGGKVHPQDWLFSFTIEDDGGYNSAEIQEGFKQYMADKTKASTLYWIATYLLEDTASFVGDFGDCWATSPTGHILWQGLKLSGVGVKLTVPAEAPKEITLTTQTSTKEFQTEGTVFKASQCSTVKDNETVTSDV